MQWQKCPKSISSGSPRGDQTVFRLEDTKAQRQLRYTRESMSVFVLRHSDRGYVTCNSSFPDFRSVLDSFLRRVGIFDFKHPAIIAPRAKVFHLTFSSPISEVSHMLGPWYVLFSIFDLAQDWCSIRSWLTDSSTGCTNLHVVDIFLAFSCMQRGKVLLRGLSWMRVTRFLFTSSHHAVLFETLAHCMQAGVRYVLSDVLSRSNSRETRS